MASSSASLVFPVLGVILSNALYFSPLPAIIRAHRIGALGALNPLPQALMVISTNAWMCYALAVPNGFIVASNLPGAIAAVGFVVVTLPLIPRDAAPVRRQVQLVLVVGAACTMLLWTYLIFMQLDHAARCFYLGAYGSAICVLLFASPLSTLKDVLATANAASIYAPLTAAQVTNCAMVRASPSHTSHVAMCGCHPRSQRVLLIRIPVCAQWTIYGLGIGDVWVWGPNATGLGLGLVQLGLKLIFPSKRRHEEQRNLCAKEACSDPEQELDIDA